MTDTVAERAARLVELRADKHAANARSSRATGMSAAEDMCRADECYSVAAAIRADAPEQGEAQPDARDAEIARLREALKPFADAADSQTVKDALSFGKDLATLYLSRGFDSYAFPPSVFAVARAALAPVPRVGE